MSQTFIISTNYQSKALKQQGLESCQDFFVKTKTKTSTYKTKTKTLFFVLEAPRDQDFGLEDYITE